MPLSNSAENIDNSPLTLTEHSYFLDRELAYKTAIENNVCNSECRTSVLPICYYDGESYDDAPLNLIAVPASEFTNFFIENSLPIPSKVLAFANADEHTRQQIETTFEDMVQEIQLSREARLAEWDGNPYHQDAYFLDPRIAYQTALLQNRVFLGHPTITGLQVCYYDGDVIENAPDNLIHVPAEQLFDYLANCRTRLPKTIVYPATANETEKSAGREAFLELLKAALESRHKLAAQFYQQSKLLAPEDTLRHSLKIFFITSRLTTVLQYAAKYLANALENLGHQTYVSMEANDMEETDSAWHLKSYLDFNPDVILNINHRNNDWLHPEVINIVWYQDPAPEILANKKLFWRENDLILSAAYPFDELLYSCGATKVRRQHFCIDTNIFQRNKNIKRVNKAVFIGSSYSFNIGESEIGHQVANQLLQHIYSGDRISEEMLHSYAVDNGLTYNYVYWTLFHYAVREASVEWLCRQNSIPVEIYGRHWENNPVVAPFLKGELPHGKAVAQVYNSARYALVAHPFEVNSQRLAEVSACGCIPVVYDCRHFAEPPHWNNECLFFLDEKQLRTQLQNKPVADPENISSAFTYDQLAQRIINMVQRQRELIE